MLPFLPKSMLHLGKPSPKHLDAGLNTVVRIVLAWVWKINTGSAPMASAQVWHIIVKNRTKNVCFRWNVFSVIMCSHFIYFFLLIRVWKLFFFTKSLFHRELPRNWKRERIESKSLTIENIGGLAVPCCNDLPPSSGKIESRKTKCMRIHLFWKDKCSYLAPTFT